MYCAFDGSIRYKRNGVENSLGDIIFTGRPQAINYRLYGEDVILLVSPSDRMVVWNGVDMPYTVPNSPLITGMTLHYERAFCTVSGERNAVWFSSDLDPTNWDPELDKGGFIQMLDERGKLNTVISFLNYVYVFRDYGISRIVAYADQNEFSASNLFVSSGKIYASSAALCGDSIVFLASDGLYRFDGLSTQKILPGLAPLSLSSPGACGAYYNGKYYLAFRADLDGAPDGGETNNCVLAADLKTGGYSILAGVFITSLCASGGGLYATTRNGEIAKVLKCGSVFGVPTDKVWNSGFSDYGTEKIKTVKEIYIESDGVFSLAVETERGKKEFTVAPELGITKIRVNLSGRKINVTLSCATAAARLARPVIVLSGQT
jgi:hypothetical protein